MQVPPGTRTGHAANPTDPPAVDIPSLPRSYHVWVNLDGHVSTRPTLEYPGLVLAWRRGGRDGWEAQVVWVTPGDQRAGDSAHLGWLPVHRLRPL